MYQAVFVLFVYDYFPTFIQSNSLWPSVLCNGLNSVIIRINESNTSFAARFNKLKALLSKGTSSARYLAWMCFFCLCTKQPGTEPGGRSDLKTDLGGIHYVTRGRISSSQTQLDLCLRQQNTPFAPAGQEERSHRGLCFCWRQIHVGSKQRADSDDPHDQRRDVRLLGMRLSTAAAPDEIRLPAEIRRRANLDDGKRIYEGTSGWS
ncbi:hypothetical protein D3C74_218050 [compost metagenome]